MTAQGDEDFRTSFVRDPAALRIAMAARQVTQLRVAVRAMAAAAAAAAQVVAVSVSVCACAAAGATDVWGARHWQCAH